MKRFFLVYLLFFSIQSSALPFTIIPKSGTLLPTSVAPGSTVMAYYTIINNTALSRNNNYVKHLPSNVIQVTTAGTYPDTAGSTFDLAANGGSCTLQLAISGPVDPANLNTHNHLFVSFPGGKTCAGTEFPLDIRTINNYINWVNSLRSGFQVVQGNTYLLNDNSCSLLESIFHSCFGPNPSSPYVIPQVPIENAYVDPYYGVPLNTPGPDGTTNIIYRLTDNDALISIVAYPSIGAYFGYQSYVFSREASFYSGPPPIDRVVSPDPNRYEIFGSIGNDINNIIVQNQHGIPWNSIVVYITTSNSNLATALVQSAVAQGIDKNSIFVEPIGANVITGASSISDDMMTLMRYAVPESSSASDNWYNALSTNVLIYKVSNSYIPIARYGENSYTPHTINTQETAVIPSLTLALQQLADLLGAYLFDLQGTATESRFTTALSQDNAQGVPVAGLVGSTCIADGTNCNGDNQDTSTYAALTLQNLGASESAFVAGINHNMFNNTRYITIDIYNSSELAGVAGLSQTNPQAVGFNSGVLTGSAIAILSILGITIPPSFTALAANISNLYVTFITRDSNNLTSISQYGMYLMGNSLVPQGDPISIAERSYIVPGTTTGGNINYMIYPIVIAATADFLPLV